MSTMKLFKAFFDLEGIMAFSSEIRPLIFANNSMGSYISTLPYIHNYPIMYGLLGKSSEAYAIIPSLHYNEYESRKQKTDKKGLIYNSVKSVIEDFIKDKQGSFYVFPLMPESLNIYSFLMSSESWSYALPVRNRLKNVFPRLTSYTAFMPGSKFWTYIIVNNNPPGLAKGSRAAWIRVGKKRWGVFKVKYEELKAEKCINQNEKMTSIPVNLADTEKFGVEIVSSSTVLRTPNISEGPIAWASIRDCRLIKVPNKNKTFEDLCLPLPAEVISKICQNQAT